MRDSLDWAPSADVETLKARAKFIDKIRAFFKMRDVLEVDVPLLSQGVALEPGLKAFSCAVGEQSYFLQTSPEFAMKRLLAAGSGPIFYLGKACRFDEVGRWHNPEFTMLEWYRPEWMPEALIQETGELLTCMLDTPVPTQMTYQSLFESKYTLNPHIASTADLIQAAKCHDYFVPALDQDDKAAWLDLLFSHGIEPDLGWQAPAVVTEFPNCQASLAKSMKNLEGEWVAARFEFYIKGVEIANGFHELTDAKMQAERFENDLDERQKLGLKSDLPVDHRLLAALTAGLPESCGIALGVDRLLMMALEKKHIRDVLAFDFLRA